MKIKPLCVMTLVGFLPQAFAQNTVTYTENPTLEMTLQGHTWDVNAVVFSPDGKTLASGGRDNTIKLWNMKDGKEKMTLQGHQDMVYSVAFSPDGQTLASGGRDNTIKLWNVKDGKEKMTLQGHQEAVTSVAFSPDGKILASGSQDNTTKLWNVENGREIRTIKGFFSDISSVAFSSDGKILASGSHDNIVNLWNVMEGKEITNMKGHVDRVYTVAFSPDGTILASGSRENTIKLWNVGSGQEILTLKGHTNSVVSLAFSPDGKILASGSSDNTIKFWKVIDGKEITTLQSRHQSVRAVAFSSDGTTFASGESDKAIEIWNVKGLMPKDAKLFVSTSPLDSQIFVNLVTQKPDADGLIPVFSGVPLEIKVSAEGFNDYTNTMTLKPRQTRSVNVELTRQMGALSFITQPNGATVTLNGVVKGKTPLVLNDLVLGDTQYALTLDDHQEVGGTVTVLGNTRVPVIVKMKELPGLNFMSQPVGAQVWIAGKMLCDQTPCTVKNLKPGPVDFVLRLSGHQEFKGRAFVPDEGKGEVDETLTRK